MFFVWLRFSFTFKVFVWFVICKVVLKVIFEFIDVDFRAFFYFKVEAIGVIWIWFDFWCLIRVRVFFWVFIFKDVTFLDWGWFSWVVKVLWFWVLLLAVWVWGCVIWVNFLFEYVWFIDWNVFACFVFIWQGNECLGWCYFVNCFNFGSSWYSFVIWITFRVVLWFPFRVIVWVDFFLVLR